MLSLKERRLENLPRETGLLMLIHRGR